MENLPFFRAAMAGLGKYRMGGYGRIGVYRAKIQHLLHKSINESSKPIFTMVTMSTII